MSSYISKEKMDAIGKLIEEKIGSDKEYFLLVADKEDKGRFIQFIKSTPINRLARCLLDFLQQVKDNSILDTPSDN